MGKATGSRERAPDDRLRVPTIVCETLVVGTAKGRLCPPYPALSAVEFPRPLFQEASEAQKFPEKSQENPAGSDKMKLVRYGAKGAEKPGLIDKSGQLRDLSAQVRDLDGEAYSPASLAKLAALDTVQASRRRRQAALRRPGHRHLEIRRDRPEL